MTVLELVTWWALVGLVLSVKIGPWRHRWFVDWIPASRPSSHVIGTLCLALLYATVWPALLWLWLRQRPPDGGSADAV